jgi:predicted ATP-grasp superfamily ATP-dependent carboligase
MTTIQQPRRTILVTDAGRGSAISIIRSLGRRGYHVIAADADPRNPGFQSRYASETWVYPNPEHAPDAFVDSMEKVVHERQVDLVIPVTDAAILPLSKERARFTNLCQIAMPDPTALAMVTNKCKTVGLAEQLGVPTPRTLLVNSTEEALEKARQFDWPIVLKPQVSRLFKEQSNNITSLTVSYAQNMAELEQRMRSYEGCPVLLQEYYAGSGQGVELLMHRGQPIAAFQHKRLREVPISGGASSFRESVPLNEDLYNYSVKLLGALKWTGLAMVEFKVGAKGPKLMEINGRVWGSLPLAVLSGMDFPAHLAELYLDGPPAANHKLITNYRVGVKARNLALDVVWILGVLYGKRRYPFLRMPSRLAGVKAALGLFNPQFKFDILSLDDPRPGLAEMGKIARSLRSKMGGGV